ncbi:MAG TPA: LPS export ABC transporter permease LptF [Gammaproteobacteria bacterium]|nr:LPS export ABC transporter permease LptF [Gammaproteobacteria bacterium]
MPTLRRYLLSEMLRGFGAVFVCLVGVYLASRAAHYIGDAAAGRLQQAVVLELVWLQLVIALPTLTPACLYLGIFITLARMQRDQELVAMQAAGSGLRFLLASSVRLGLVVGLLLFVVAVVLTPWAERRSQDIRAQAAEVSDASTLIPGRFRELSGTDHVLYFRAAAREGGVLSDVFLYADDGSGFDVLRAREAEFIFDPATRQRWVEFRDGTREEGTNADLANEGTRFERYRVRMDHGSREGGGDPTRTKSRGSLDLLMDDSPTAAAELQWRMAPLFVALNLSLLAVLVVGSGSGRGRRRDLPILIALLAYFLYNNVLGIARTMVRREQLPEWLGLWSVHLFALMIMALVYFWPAIRHRLRRARMPFRLAGAR